MVADAVSRGGERVRAAEVMAVLSLATDLGIGVPLEHGLQSTLVAMRLGELLGVDSDTASQTYYACLLFYVGCTADAEVAAETFGDDNALTTFAMPARFGSKPEMLAGIMRALASSGSPMPVRALQIARGMPRAAREFKGHITAFCEVAQMLTDRLGLPASMQGLFGYLVERWDGKGLPGGARGEEIPLPVRIASVARDAAFQHMLGGAELAARVVRRRAGGAFDPAVAIPLADAAAELLDFDADASAW
jgi:HD domain